MSRSLVPILVLLVALFFVIAFARAWDYEQAGCGVVTLETRAEDCARN